MNSTERLMDSSHIDALVRSRSGIAGHQLVPADVARFVATIEALPPPPVSVLDVGCGAGVLADVIHRAGYTVLGIDTDEAAMAEMTAPHRYGGIEALPVPDRSYDVVVLNEILEHLPVGVYERGLSEVRRVATSGVVVTVPNGESLESASTRCPQCGCVYSVHGHVRRFDRPDLDDLLEDFILVDVRPVGPFKLRHRTIEWYLKRRLLGRWPAQPGATCPQCGLAQEGTPTRGGPSGSPLRWLAAVPWHRWWLTARYERRTARG